MLASYRRLSNPTTGLSVFDTVSCRPGQRKLGRRFLSCHGMNRRRFRELRLPRHFHNILCNFFHSLVILIGPESQLNLPSFFCLAGPKKRGAACRIRRHDHHSAGDLRRHHLSKGRGQVFEEPSSPRQTPPAGSLKKENLRLGFIVFTLIAARCRLQEYRDYRNLLSRRHCSGQ